jgi:hypothetical protein
MAEVSDFSPKTSISPLETRAFIVAALSVILGTALTYVQSKHIASDNIVTASFNLVLALTTLGLTLYWFRLRKRLLAQPRAQQSAGAPAPKAQIWVRIARRLLSIVGLLALGGLAGAFSWTEWIAVAGAIAYAAWRTWEAVPSAKLGIGSAPFLFAALLGGAALFELVGVFIGWGFRHP